MPLPKEQAWFAAKTYGWGWGLPLRWQGWTVLMLFIVAMIAGSPLIKNGTTPYVIYSLALGLVVFGICYWKGEKPMWRWGSDKLETRK